MIPPTVFPLVASSMVVPCALDGDARDVFDSEGPSSSPTILVEVDEITTPTALPAPPRLPTIAAFEGFRPPPPSAVPVIRTTFALVNGSRVSARPTVRVPELGSHELRVVHPSMPPTMPPSSPALRRVA